MAALASTCEGEVLSQVILIILQEIAEKVFINPLDPPILGEY